MTDDAHTPTNMDQTVDGFSDNPDSGEHIPGEPDPVSGHLQPMSEEERMEAQREIDAQGDNNRLKERQQQGQ